MSPVTLSRRDARRVAVRAQWLTRERPADVLETVRHLTLLQLEPTRAVAPSADLVLWSRLGSGYDPGELDRLLDEGRLVELRQTIRPAEDVALYRADMAAWPGPPPLRPWQAELAAWLEANDVARREVLLRLEDLSPQRTGELPDLTEVPWRSSGWTHDKNLDRLLTLMVQRGEVAVAGREAGQRVWDLADRVYPEVPPVPAEEAARRRAERRLAALGLARGRAPQSPVEPLDVGRAGVEAVVEGTTGPWRVDPACLDSGERFTGRAALLSPFDRLVQDRRRVAEVFGFEYVPEMYKPVGQRHWGYYALPVLYGDALVGKLDATADRRERVLRVHTLHWDVEPSRAMAAAVGKEVADLARWLGIAVG